MEVSGQLHDPAALLPGKEPLNMRLGEPQSRSGHGGEEKNSQPLMGLQLLIIQPVAQRYTTEISWLFSNSIAEKKKYFPRIRHLNFFTGLKIRQFLKMNNLSNSRNNTEQSHSIVPVCRSKYAGSKNVSNESCTY
jgi:hypothetical protein